MPDVAKKSRNHGVWNENGRIDGIPKQNYA